MQYEHEGNDTARICALSDGLFAVVLTLLVLDLKPPDPAGLSSDTGLIELLAELWPKTFSYFLTFVVGGLYWMAHHWDFEHIIGYNRRLLWLNLMFLLSVSLLPFSTALVGARLSPLAWTYYSSHMIGIGLTLAAVWGYAVARQLVDPSVDPQLARFVIMSHLLTPAVFLLSAVLAYFALDVAVFLPIALPLVQAVGRRVYSRTVPMRGHRDAHERGHPRGELFWTFVGLLPLIGFAGWTIWLWIIGRM